MKIEWKPEEYERLSSCVGRMATADEVRAVVEAIAGNAVSLFLARASWQVKEDARVVRANLVPCEPDCPGRVASDDSACPRHGALSRLSALAQESESLRAKVAALEERLEGTEASHDDEDAAHAETLEQLSTARAEVERLKAEIVTQHAHRKEFRDRATAAESRLVATKHWAERAWSAEALANVNASKAVHNAAELQKMEARASIAESRLAAIRGKLGDEAIEKWMDEPHDPEPLSDDALLRAFARWLEGDAPQEAKAHDIYACHVENCADCTRGIETEIDQKGPAVVAVEMASAAGLPVRFVSKRYPCSPTCTHDDAATPGHPERVNEQSVAVARAALGLMDPAPHGDDAEVALEQIAESDAYDMGAEAMRAACLEDVRQACDRHGIGWFFQHAMAAIEGAAP